MIGVRVLLLHPEVANRPCSACKEYVHLDAGPKFGRLFTRGGKPVPRAKGDRPPCQWCPKIAAGDEPCPENAQELSPENQQALAHYQECKAVGEFPKDAIVRRNAGLIAAAEAHADRVHQTRTGLAVLGTIFKGA